MLFIVNNFYTIIMMDKKLMVCIYFLGKPLEHCEQFCETQRDRDQEQCQQVTESETAVLNELTAYWPGQVSLEPKWP